MKAIICIAEMLKRLERVEDAYAGYRDGKSPLEVELEKGGKRAWRATKFGSFGGPDDWI